MPTDSCDSCVSDGKYWCPSRPEERTIDRARCVKHLTLEQKSRCRDACSVDDGDACTQCVKADKHWCPAIVSSEGMCQDEPGPTCVNRCDACALRHNEAFSFSSGRRPHCDASASVIGVCKKCKLGGEDCTRNSDCDGDFCSGNAYGMKVGTCEPAGRLGGVFCKKDRHCSSGICVMPFSLTGGLRGKTWGACAIGEAERSQIDAMYGLSVRSSRFLSRSRLESAARERRRIARGKARVLLGGEACDKDTDCIASRDNALNTCDAVSTLSRDECAAHGCKWDKSGTCTSFVGKQTADQPICFGKGNVFSRGVCLRAKRSFVEDFVTRKLSDERIRMLRDRSSRSSPVRAIRANKPGGETMSIETETGGILEVVVPEGLVVGDVSNRNTEIGRVARSSSERWRRMCESRMEELRRVRRGGGMCTWIAPSPDKPKSGGAQRGHAYGKRLRNGRDGGGNGRCRRSKVATRVVMVSSLPFQRECGRACNF